MENRIPSRESASLVAVPGAPATRPDVGGARSVAGIHRRAPLHWVGDGFYVSSYFPRASLPAERVSPFLLMDYGPPRDFAPNPGAPRGVGWHPHRGFETVTVAWEGSVAHRDTAGHAGVIGPGDVQWMTAGAGLLHEEYHEAGFGRLGGRMHMMQLWVNLPRRHKFAPPGYQGIAAARIPSVALPDGAGEVRVVAGRFGDASGPARTFTPISLLDVRLAAGGVLRVPLPAGHNALAIVTAGHAEAGDPAAPRAVGAGELVLYGNDGAFLELRALDEARVLVLAGEPIDEPIVQYGPFVMNTSEEIDAAIVDFQRGAFGRPPDA